MLKRIKKTMRFWRAKAKFKVLIFLIKIKSQSWHTKEGLLFPQKSRIV